MPRQPIGYSALIDRPPLRWPDDARVAVWIQVNLEHWGVDGPGTTLPPTAPRAVPGVDAKNTGWRDYGARVGLWRLMEVLDRHGMRGSAPINADVCTYYPEVIREVRQRSWELMGHGLSNDRTLAGLSVDEERAVVRTSIEALTAAMGRPPKGWLGPGLVETTNTFDLLAEAGIEYVADWCNDDQPFPVEVKSGRLIGVPYSMEINDIPAFLGAGLSPRQFFQTMCDQFDVLYEEGASTGRIFGLCLHPFIAGQAFRAKWLDKGLEYVARHKQVWLATAEEIAAWYYQHYYTSAVAAQRERAQRVPAPVADASATPTGAGAHAG